MSIPYELSGRTNQKARTRNALVAATRELLAEGVTPTVEQAADRAGISRTTSYRYFPNQRALLLATWPELESPSLMGEDAPADPVERLMLAFEHVTRQVVLNEPVLRAQLQLALDPATRPDDLPLRRGRVIGWYTDALEPLRDELGDAGLRRLVLAIRAATGIEALVWLTDVAGLSREEATETLRWSARTLAEAAVAAARR